MGAIFFSNIKNIFKYLLPGIILFWLLQTFITGGAYESIRAENPHKVHIAFGFHGNLYHSFRGDTNDEQGFGMDIRIIRKTIQVLDKYNSQGVPVKAVWDFDNMFSLQELLPRYAPDIITDIKRRVSSRGDEAILMSYNNGIMSAMNRREFMDSIKWAVTNPWGSGVKDIFGTYSPIVRPQEMMTTPGNFNLYKQAGIPYISLYYSATPFDTFRVFADPLTMAQAHNPLTYKNAETNEEIIIIPTYNIGDLLENVSLQAWAEKLHHLQETGEINQDVLIFINFDADSEFWYGVDLPWYLDWLPDTKGLDGLIRQVKDLEYVKFTNLMDYLNTHQPAGEVRFSQDTADGSFNGYNSWSEKAYAPAFWSAIEKNRRVHSAVEKTFQLMQTPVPDQIQSLKDQSYMLRLRMLSTTNFGMATPFLAPQREKVADTLATRLNQFSDKLMTKTKAEMTIYFQNTASNKVPDKTTDILDIVLLANDNDKNGTAAGRYLTFTLPDTVPAFPELTLSDLKGRKTPLSIISKTASSKDNTLSVKAYVPQAYDLPDGPYIISTCTEPCHADKNESFMAVSRGELRNRQIRVTFNDRRITGLWYNGVQQLEKGSLLPHIRYGDQVITPDKLNIYAIKGNGNQAKSIGVSGQLNLPGENSLTPGMFDYQFTLVDGLPYLFIDGKITYPETVKDTINKNVAPAMRRKMDVRWKETAPVELRLAQQATAEDPFKIIKRNYLGVQSSYALNYYQHATRNRNLDDINNHITAEFVGVSGKNSLVAVAMDTTVMTNFAFAPMKMQYNKDKQRFNLRINPFGTYHGSQYYPPTWGNRNGYEATVLTGYQFKSAAPTYNGYTNTFSIMVAFSNTDQLPEATRQDLIAFARPPVMMSLTNETELSAENNHDVRKTASLTDTLIAGIPSKTESVSSTTDIHLPDIPISFQLKVLWAHLNAML